MPQIKPQSNPGFISQATQVQAQGAWFDGNLVRWRFGLLEKIGGWRRLIEEQFAAPIRKMHAWADLENYKNLLVATDLGLQLVVNENKYGLGSQIDLQGGFVPTFGPVTETTKFSATAGSRTVTVKTNAFAAAGGTILFQLAISVGGRIIPAGSFFTIKSVTLGVGFTFDMPMPALSNETDTYGIRLYTNDIVNGMTATWKAHGLGVGDAFEIPQATSLKTTVVDFNAPAKRMFRVDTVPSLDTFTFSMGAAGTGDGTGGPSHQVYEGSTLGSSGNSIGTVIGVAVLRPLGDPQKQNWFLDNLGQDGLALQTGGPLQVYTPPIEEGPFIVPVGGGTAVTAPQKSNGMLVAMPQAQVILWGTEAIMGEPTTLDPLLIRWSDVGTYDKYTAAVGNQAGQYRLSRGSKIMGAIQAPQMTLIFTDTDLWSMSYIGPPLIYGFTIVASGCGLDAAHDVGVLGTAVVWKSKQNFWMFGGGGAQVLPCSVWDYAFKNIDEVNINKSFAAPNSSATEIGFYFAAKTTAKELEEKDESAGNLLLFSNDLMEAARWKLTGAATLRPSLFKHLYVYEAQYIRSGWFDDSGLNPISWFDYDVQMQLEQVILAPDGTDTATLLQEFAINGEHAVSQTVNKAQERKTYTLSIYAHNSSTRNLTLRATSSQGVGVFATFNVVTGVMVASGVTSTAFSLMSTAVTVDALATGTNGWRRYIMTFVSDDKATLTASFNNANGTSISYLGDVTKGCLIWGPQLVEGSVPLDYEITTGFQVQNEPGYYVKFNPQDKAWDSGRLPRTAWIDDNVWGTPLGADANFRVQQHEVGFDDDDQPMRGVFAETGYAELGDGAMMVSINECQPDFKWFGRDGAMRVSLRAQNYSGGPDHLYGPWSMTPGTQFFCPRVRARRVAIRYEWEPLRGYSSRVGTTSYLVKPAGKRP